MDLFWEDVIDKKRMKEFVESFPHYFQSSILVYILGNVFPNIERE
jgi:hypothetical protein